jgi:Leucine-rich repeat (LRR) protein
MLSGLMVLDASENNLSELPGPPIPDKLEHLFLDHNDFEHLPDISMLSNLKQLRLTANRLATPPTASELGIEGLKIYAARQRA